LPYGEELQVRRRRRRRWRMGQGNREKRAGERI